MRDESFATIYSSDTTYMTKLGRLCKTSPDVYSLIADTGRGKTYRVEDKILITFRAKKRELSTETIKLANLMYKLNYGGQ